MSSTLTKTKHDGCTALEPKCELWERIGCPPRIKEEPRFYPKPTRTDHAGCADDPRDCPDVLTCGAYATLNDAMIRVQVIEAAERVVAEEAIRAELDAGPAERDVALLLPVETADDILRGTPEMFDPVLVNLAYRRLRTLVVGQSKAGKSFTIWARMVDAVRDGRRILYLTEESRDTVADKLRTFGLEESGPVMIVRKSHPDLLGKRWGEIAAMIVATARAHRADLVVIDTARAWFGLKDDQGNSADVIGACLDALDPLREENAAVVTLHQAPWDKHRARGSTEFHAANDLIFAVVGEGKMPRTIKYVGGRVESIPEEQTLRWSHGRGEDLGRMRRDVVEGIDEVLGVLETATRGLTIEEVLNELEVEATERTVRRWLAKLEQRGKVRREKGEPVPGEGGTPDRWFRVGDSWSEMVKELLTS